MRWIIWPASCSSTICPASSASASAASSRRSTERREQSSRGGASRRRLALPRAPYDACCASPLPVRRSSRCRRCEALAGSSHTGWSGYSRSLTARRPRPRPQRQSRSSAAPSSSGLPVAQPDQPRQPRSERAALASLAAGLLVVVAYGLLLPSGGAARCRGSAASTCTPRCCRAGAARRRSSAPSWPGMRDTGVTHHADGSRASTPAPILAQRARRHRRRQQRRGQLQERLARAGCCAAARHACRRSQPGTAHAARAAGRGRDLRRQARQARGAHRLAARAPRRSSRQVRAFNPWPVAETCWCGGAAAHLGGAAWPARRRRRRSASLRAVSQVSPPAPGTVLGLTGEALLVACGQGVLAVTRAAARGPAQRCRRAEFVRGQHARRCAPRV